MTVGSRRRSTGPDKLTIEGVYLRCEGLCEGCGERLHGTRGLEHQAHHRRPRRMGGSQLPDTNSVENILMLGQGCHSYVESQRTWAYRWGFLVRQDDIPAAIPVLLHGGAARPGPRARAAGRAVSAHRRRPVPACGHGGGTRCPVASTAS